MYSMVSDKNIKRSLIILDEFKKLYMVRFYQDSGNNKIVLIADFLVIDEDYINVTHAHAIKFFTEIKLFEKGDSQNTFFQIVEKNGDMSLKLKSSKYKLYLSKSDAFTITEIMNNLNKFLDGPSPFILDYKVYDHEWYTMYFILHKLKKEKDCGISDEDFQSRALILLENGETAFKPDFL